MEPLFRWVNLTLVPTKNIAAVEASVKHLFVPEREKRMSISGLLASMVTEPPPRGIKPVERVLSLVKGSTWLINLQSCDKTMEGNRTNVNKNFMAIFKT